MRQSSLWALHLRIGEDAAQSDRDCTEVTPLRRRMDLHHWLDVILADQRIAEVAWRIGLSG